MSGRAVALWGAQIRVGENIVSAREFADLPIPVVITMAAIDPTAEPASDGPKRATLKIIRRPISSMYDDMGDSDEDSDEESEESEDEEEEEAPKKKKKGGKKGGDTDQMDVDGGRKIDPEDLSDDEGLDGLELEEFVVCTLDTERNYQQPLTLTIGDNEDIFFKVTGNYDVYLTGNYIDFSHDHDHDHDEDDESDEDYDLSPSEGELYGDTDSEDELDGLVNPRIQELETDSEEEAAPKKSQKKDKKAEKKDNKKRAAEEAPEKPAEGGAKQKKAKANDGKAVPVETSTKKEDQKKVKFAKNLEQGPTPSPAAKEKKESKKGDDKKKAEDKKPAATSGPRKVNGVTIHDKTVGTGPQAKSGQKVNMRYVGKLQNGKVFDSNTKGKPFSFTLGKGEVIKGWDIGIQGMQLGGERRITIPAELAYGKKALPGIPANSTLLFDVKLLAIK